MTREIGFGAALAGVTSGILAAIPEPLAKGAVSLLLTVIASIYVGFSLSSRGKLPYPKQIAGAVVFILLAFMGLFSSWWFLAAGLALHGLWDALHHGRHAKGVVPPWYIPFCAAYDLCLALFVAVFYALR